MLKIAPYIQKLSPETTHVLFLFSQPIDLSSDFFSQIDYLSNGLLSLNPQLVKKKYTTCLTNYFQHSLAIHLYLVEASDIKKQLGEIEQCLAKNFATVDSQSMEIVLYEDLPNIKDIYNTIKKKYMPLATLHLSTDNY